MHVRSRLTPHILETEVYKPTESMPIVISTLKSNAWCCSDSDELQIFEDMQRGVVIVDATYNRRKQISTAIDAATRLDMSAFAIERLRIAKEDRDETIVVFEQMKRHWSQSLLSLMKKCMEATLLEAGLFYEVDYVGTISRDAETGAIYVDAILSNIRLGNGPGKCNCSVAGTVRHRFKMTKEDMQSDRGFKFDSVTVSNGLLKDFCLNPTFFPPAVQGGPAKSIYFKQRIADANEEERQQQAHRLNHHLAELEATMDDPKLNATLKNTSCHLWQTINKSKLQEENLAELSQLAEQASQANKRDLGVPEVTRYTPALLSNESKRLSERIHAGIAKMERDSWFSDPKDGDVAADLSLNAEQFFRDLKGQVQVVGNKYTVLNVDNENDKIDQFAQTNLKLPDESGDSFDFYYQGLKRHWSQNVFNTFQVFIQSSLEKAGLTAKSNYKTNISRDPESGAIWVETTIRDIKAILPESPTNRVQVDTAIPGTVTYRFKLNKEDIVEGTGFHLDYVEPSNSLLRDLCFSGYNGFATEPFESVDFATLRMQAAARKSFSARVIFAEQEEHERARRKFYHSLVDLEQTVNDKNIDVTLRERGKAVLEGLTQYKGEKKADYHTLTEAASATNQMIRHPLRSNYADYLELSKRVPSRRSKGKMLLGAMLILLGVVVVAASIAVAVASFGIATPLSALGIAVGVSAVTAGIACGAAVAGVAAATGGGILLFKGQQSKPKDAMEALAETVHRQQPALVIR